MLDRFGGAPRASFWLFAAVLALAGLGALVYGRWYSENGYRQLTPTDATALAAVTARLDAWDEDLATLKEVRAVMDDLTARYPETPPVLVESARLDLARNNFGTEQLELGGLLASAEGKLRTALLVAPRDLRANVLMAHLETYNGDFPSARDRLTIADDLVAEDGWRDVNWGDLLARQGHDDEAIARYARAIFGGAANPRTVATAICRLAHTADGPRQMAKRDPIAIAMHAQGRSGADMVAVARAVAHTGCANQAALLKAQDLLGWAERYDPPLAELHVAYAEIFLRLDFGAGAGDHLHDDLVEIYAQKAYDHINKALAADPDNAVALAIKAGLLFDGRDHAGAEAVVTYAEQHGISHPLLSYERGRLLQQAGKHREAAAVYAQVQATSTHGYAAHYAASYRRWALVAAGDLDAAEDAFIERTVEQPHADWAYADTLRFLLEHRGDAERAYAYGEQHMDQLSGDAGRRIWAAVLYVRWAQLTRDAEQPELASGLYEVARSMYPDPSGLFRYMGPNRELVERALGLPVTDAKPVQQRT